jgi:hypothetical protein
MKEINKQWEKQAKWLMQALILSGALNVGFLLTFIYFILQDSPVKMILDHKPAGEEGQAISIVNVRGHAETIKEIKAMTFDQLVAKLHDKQLVEDGYYQRDLALGCLVSFYHFNLHRAISGVPTQQRQLTFDQQKEGSAGSVIVFPGLTDANYQSIIHFATTERWPLTSKGLFLQLKHTKENIDPSLMEAFLLTPEFLEVKTLFSHSKGPKDRAVILAMLQEGDWQVLSDFYRGQLIAQDLSEGRYQRLLLDYIEKRSKIAARLMLLSYGDFAVKKLDDRHVMAILHLLREKTPESEHFAQELLISPRSDAVLKLAAARLYQFAKEPLPEHYDHIAALTKFIPQQVLKEKLGILNENPKPPSDEVKDISPPTSNKAVHEQRVIQPKLKEVYKKERFHIVGEGESLWAIAKRYHVDIEIIKSYNGLESNTLYSGLVLRIPSA